MPFLHRDDVALFYERTGGKGPPVVLIHGWCCDHTFFAPQAAHFAQAGHAIISLDLRGHGRSDKPRQSYPISAFAADVAWICGALGLLRPVLVGHSMGGIVAFDVACRHPDLPSAVVMLDSAVVLPAAVRAAIPQALERLRSPHYAAALRELVNGAFFLPTDDAARRVRILDLMAATPQHVMAAAYAGLADYDAGAVANRLKAPSLYIAANEPSPRADMDRLGALVPHMLRGETVGSGHFCQLEVPEQVNAMIDRFLSVLPSAARN
jgi:pimeloyl-ACP methyl ester carboxylesterase